uniref:Hyaluronan/mRNA-binding protein domain-containing protein n=1 Tax=Nannospalax galili TaxID=1026970 RepID=A0A8C6QXI7_NANGA
MPGHLQEGFGRVVTNRFDQLFDDESAGNKKKETAAGGVALPPKSAAQAVVQTNSKTAGKQLSKESQKDLKNPLPPSVSMADKKEETQLPLALKKEGIRRVRRRLDQQLQGEGKIINRRPERRPPRERKFEKLLAEKGEGSEFSVDRPIIDRPIRGHGGQGRGRGSGCGMGRGDGFDSCGKCEFDRHSGSDRSVLKHEDKCGNELTESPKYIQKQISYNCSDLDQSNVTEETPEGEEHPVENEVEEVKEEGPKVMTLDEWKAIQNKDRAKVEFIADGQWKKGFVLHKSKSEEAHAEDSVMDHHFWKPANDITYQLEINFGDLGRPRHGGRGGCGGCPNRGSRTDKSFCS